MLRLGDTADIYRKTSSSTLSAVCSALVLALSANITLMMSQADVHGFLAVGGLQGSPSVLSCSDRDCDGGC